MKYFGIGTRKEFIEEILEVGHLWIRYKEASYVFTIDGIGYHFQPQTLKGEPVTGEEFQKKKVSADTLEELIDKVILYDGVTLNEALEMDSSMY